MLGTFINNPLNIRYSPLNKWIGQTGSEKGFCKFENIDYGLRAGIIVLRSYCRLGYLNVGDILVRYAPPSENNTRKYARFVVRKSGVTRISSVSDVLKILVQMCYYESHYEVTESYLWNVFNKFGLKEVTFFINPNKH